MHWVFLLLAIITEVLATSALKYSHGFTRLLPTLGALTAFGVSFYCLSLSLRTLPMGMAYALWAGVGIVLISIIGALAFGQRLDTPAVIGIGLIMAGVVCMKFFSTTTVH